MTYITTPRVLLKTRHCFSLLFCLVLLASASLARAVDAAGSLDAGFNVG